MALASYLPMASAGLATPNHHQDFAGVMTEDDAKDAPESGEAFVFVVGNGLASHWATIWAFPSDGAFVVELTAVDRETKQRWGRSDFTMRRLTIQQLKSLSGEGASAGDTDSSSLSGESASAGDMDSSSFSGEGASADPELGNPAGVLSNLWPTEGSDDVRESVIDYIQLHKYQVLNKGPIRIQHATPYHIYEKARSLPITGKHYDMLFHNCQLFVVQLLSASYDVDTELLPVPVGAVISGPIAASLHIIFVLLYGSLGLWVGLLMLVVEIVFVAWHLLYVRPIFVRFWAWMVFGMSLLCSLNLIFGFLDPSSPASKVPAVVLYWDLYAAILAADTNYGFSTGKLAAWNLLMLVIAAGAAMLLQWTKGWPALDVLWIPVTAVSLVAWVVG